MRWEQWSTLARMYWWARPAWRWRELVRQARLVLPPGLVCTEDPDIPGLWWVHLFARPGHRNALRCAVVACYALGCRYLALETDTPSVRRLVARVGFQALGGNLWGLALEQPPLHPSSLPEAC